MNWEGTVEVVVLIKAAPETGAKHGETVCVAGIDCYGAWHRLYPMPFKDLRLDQVFRRWDIIRVRWRKAGNDERIESKRIDHTTLEVVGRVPKAERAALIDRALVDNIDVELAEGRSLAVLRPENVEFSLRRLADQEVAKQRVRRQQLISQSDLFGTSILSEEPAPYTFTYKFDHGGKRRTHRCIDWETEHTFFKWRGMYGEEDTIRRMTERWGQEYPTRGMAFAMGTHRVKIYRNWLLSAVLRADRVEQSSLNL
ncbi:MULTISPECIES: hypothetical protein [unclassified Mameliella]|uniref:hypothetical protein n=1 Tax=unclassified Mameliella TaxID=2630630 RepID=UPI00273D964E|nr:MULTISPECIES: hypothetical protein [unclassified Mameliella]